MKTKIAIFVAIIPFFLPTLASAQTPVSGTLTEDAVWTSAGSPYIISALGLTVPAGVTLTVEQGVIVKASQSNTPLTINGTLDVQGTGFFPTYFTSFNDTTVGGDTGFSSFGFSWSGITANPGAIIRLNHAVIRNASVGISNNGGTSTVSNSAFENGTSGISHSAGTTTVAASMFQNNQTGIWGGGTGTVSFTGNTFSNNPTLAYFDLSGGLTFFNSGNIANGVGRKGIFLYSVGDNLSDQTLSGDTIPYVITVFGVTIPAGKTFTVEQSAIIKFEQSNASLTVNGTLDMRGTQANPIYVTSFADDTLGGDTDGNTAQPQNQWGNIAMNFGATANLTHVILKRGGGLVNNGGMLSISYSEITGSGGYGIIHASGATTIASSTISANVQGISAGGTGVISITNNTFSDNGTLGSFELSSGLTFVNSGNTATGTGRKGFFLYAADSTNVSNQILSGSIPYVVNVFGVTIPAGKTFTLSPGVIIKFEQDNASLYVTGTLTVQGTAEAPVSFTSLDDDTLGGDTDGGSSSSFISRWGSMNINSDATANFNHAILKRGGMLINEGGTLTISNSEISDSGSYGILHGTGTTTVSQSSIHDNASYGVYNNTTAVLTARNNYWGSPMGPTHSINPDGTGDRVSDFVDFTPWLGYDPTIAAPLTLTSPTETEDDNNQDGKGVADKTKFTFSVTVDGTPDTVNLIVGNGQSTTTLNLTRTTLVGYAATSTFPKGHYTWHVEATSGGTTVQTPDRNFMTGYSNVAFLPGLEASRLYQNLPVLGEAQLWEAPLIHNNTKLFLNASGTPVTNGIYTKRDGEIDEAYGFNIYKSFINSMNQNITDGIIHAWEPLPYDWRYDVRDIVDHPIALATTTYSMTEEIQKLAESSDTGKVTIIAHSNGGLVGKTLISEMDSMGCANTLDKFIMVAVPQLGTPQAIVALLHGEGMPSDMLPILLSKIDSRTLAENMPSGYSLLPSTEYLARVIDPVATFDSTDPLTAQYFTKYGSVITNQTELHGFLLGADGRTKPATNDTFTPNVLNSILLSQAESNHAILDHWIAPAGMEITQIAGWGVPTVSGLNYTSAGTCGGGCIVLDHEPVFTSDGDVTVVTPSAVAMGVNTYYVNLKKYNSEFVINPFGLRNREHSNILEVLELRALLNGIIQNKVSSVLANITTIKPTPSPSDTPSLRLKVHSPVSLNLYDSFGEHTGLATTTNGVQIIEKQIPNSYYFEMGEVKYAGGDMVGTSTIKLVGQALGTFTLDVEKVVADTVVASTTFAGIPVTASTTAVLSIQDLATSSAPVLVMDINGDGITDATITAGNGVSAKELLSVLRGLVKTLHLPQKKEEKLLKEVDKLDKVLAKDDKDGKKNERNQKHRTKEAFNEIEKTITKFQKKNLLAKDEADELISIIEQIKGTVVK